MADLHVTWDDYHRDIETLAAKVHDSGWRFDQIVCIARGGLRIGDTLSRIFKLPLAIISTQSYAGDAGRERGALTVAKHMTMTTPSLGDRVLLADDLVDSGGTLDAVQHHLRDAYPAIADLRTAVLWYKACSRCTPDYSVRYLPENPWIHQPFEPYERMSVRELRERVGDPSPEPIKSVGARGTHRAGDDGAAPRRRADESANGGADAPDLGVHGTTGIDACRVGAP